MEGRLLLRLMWVATVLILPVVEVTLESAASFERGGPNSVGCLEPTAGWITDWGLEFAGGWFVGIVAYLITPVIDTGSRV